MQPGGSREQNAKMRRPKMGGSRGRRTPQVMGVRIEMSPSYAVCGMLHAACCMLCMLYAVMYAAGSRVASRSILN